MRIVAIETSTRQGSIALLDQNGLVNEMRLAVDQRTAQSLSPAMAESLQRAGWSPRSVDLVAVTNGPGSFTGLRIAVTAAKVFAYATGARLIALDTLRVLVEQLPESATEACAVMDAQRRQLFCARYCRAEDGHWEAIEQNRILDREALAGSLSAAVVLTGPVLNRLECTSLDRQPRADRECWEPRASTVGLLASQAYETSQSDDPFKLQPRYYRPSYAEEKKR